MKVQTVTTKKLFELDLRSAELMVLAFLCLLAAFELVFGPQLAAARPLALVNIGVVAVFILVLSGVRKIQPPAVQTLCAFAGVQLLTSLIYNQMGKIIHLVFSRSFDEQITAIETFLFQRHPNAWSESFATPWLTEVMMFAYVIYVPLLPALGIYLAFKGTKGEADRYLMELTLTFLVCYLFYFLVPVLGPSRALAAERTVPMEGYVFTALVQLMITNVHLPGGAFPSAHCAATIVMLAALYRHRRAAGYLFIPLAMLIFASTVYGWFHYVTDVVAGISLAIVVLHFAPRIAATLDGGIMRLRLPAIRWIGVEEAEQ